MATTFRGKEVAEVAYLFDRNVYEVTYADNTREDVTAEEAMSQPFGESYPLSNKVFGKPKLPATDFAKAYAKAEARVEAWRADEGSRLHEMMAEAMARMEAEKYTHHWDTFKYKKPVTRPLTTILVVAADADEAFQLAREMGWEGSKFVAHYRDMLAYRNCSVYVTERGRRRTDYGAIEGLFIEGGHTVLDLME